MSEILIRSEVDVNWYVLWAPKGYRESSILRLKTCLGEKAEVYTPHYTIFRRKRNVRKFILPGYLFLHCDYNVSLEEEIKKQALGAFFLKDGGNKVSKLTEDDIEKIRVEEQKYRGNPEKTELGIFPGDVVEVKEGPFVKRKGPVLRIGEDFVYVSILLFARPMELPFRFFEVEKQ